MSKKTTNYFSEAELACSCGHCETQMDVYFMERLNLLREAYGKPIILSSAYRCPRWNARVSSTGMSGPHTTGKAVDIKVSGSDAWRILKEAMKLGFSGIGIKQKGPHDQRFIHIDTIDTGTRPWIWSY